MKKTAVISGVGAGLGASLAHKFAREGCQVALLARSADYLENLAGEILKAGGTAKGFPTDITDSEKVAHSFAQIREQFGKVDILVNHAGNAAWGDFSELTPDEFERSWRICALGSFLCSQQAVPDMVSAGSGTILFTGATSGIRGRAGAIAFSSAKFAVRGLAWSLAREVGPKGIHVAHIIIDGILDTPAIRSDTLPDVEEPLLNTDAVADVYWSLVEQDKSTWTFELDLRPHNEDFFG
ncbi:MAG: SDR family NAD(P)-dependent oxidoreductase [Candidatus Poribacteria bacterium]|nr:SDR family NAD(P)-dependent oxidoreductase [Candidatus Poribacteria bacterium]